MAEKRVRLENFFSKFALALILIAAVGASAVFAQSGRRVQTKTLPAPTPEATPEQKLPAPKPAVKPDFFLKIVSNIPATSYNQIAFPENMQKWIGERLADSSLLEIIGRQSGRMKDAKEMAKNATDEYIVFIELNENIFANTTRRTRAIEGEMWISFSVFEPKTGRAKQSGTSYLKPELLRNRGVLGGRRASCYPTLSDSDYLLWQASYEVAERIMAGFNVPVPPVKCGSQPF